MSAELDISMYGHEPFEVLPETRLLESEFAMHMSSMAFPDDFPPDVMAAYQAILFESPYGIEYLRSLDDDKRSDLFRSLPDQSMRPATLNTKLIIWLRDKDPTSANGNSEINNHVSWTNAYVTERYLRNQSMYEPHTIRMNRYKTQLYDWPEIELLFLNRINELIGNIALLDSSTDSVIEPACDKEHFFRFGSFAVRTKVTNELYDMNSKQVADYTFIKKRPIIPLDADSVAPADVAITQ